jgi:hypothetical protein
VRAPKSGFTTAQAAGTPSAPQIQVVLNWFEDVKQRALGK